MPPATDTQAPDPRLRLLDGRNAFVTGGGRGLGAAICRELARAGAAVVVADRDAANAERVAAELVQLGARSGAQALDVADDSSVRRALQGAQQTLGRVDIVINNAAIDITAPIDEIDAEAWHRVLMTNLYGPYLVSRAVVPSMKAHGGGHIVNIASTASKRAWPNASAYHATKWGLLGLSHALHAELRPAGIGVSAIVAGGMRTPFLLDRFPEIDVETLQAPENVAAAVRFVLTQPPGTVVPELMVLPTGETSWP
ncbi:SDR family oxidoreductase [Burkholderia gladioli]|uniref:Short-chain dehydrogenase/reductase SDR n=3 Tax=Burkholderia gladioli TaxID=28095 RepID=F2LMI9_BURGS|nr:SDR family oxidoreductase [Burkholderia gladioli]AEA64432.1 short-chain dehydrogenase/reductase SDR [Burkholderia gladioli BSR3]MCH7269023.1 SDR family oxidoreductase [Burkholderia gladioli]MDN7496148.1 SDR family oxidoreductase [Burkholderia gladioli]MDN7921691.1 SDR family oxidoreductase [Burkholderia gladioli]MDN8058107.1 SDR family oxidoreductase [Burkholderia gladioli]